MNDEFKNLNLHVVFKDVLRSLWVVVLAFAGVKLLLWSYITLTFVPKYSSSVTLAVSTRNASTLYTDLNNASSMAKVLSEVLDSNLLTDVVNEELGKDAGTLKYNCSVIPNTNLMTISVTAGDARTAYTAVNCVIDHYQEVSASVIDNAVFHIVQQPAVAFGAVNSPNTKPADRVALLAAFAVLCAIVYDSWKRPTLKYSGEVTEKLNVPLIGTLPHEIRNKSIRAKLKKVNKGVLIANAASSFSFVEQTRQTRTRFQSLCASKDVKSVVFTSFLENEGKSTVMINLAIALAQKGKRVLVVDADLRKPALYKLTGHAEENKRSGIAELLRGTAEMKEVIRWEAPFYFWSCAGTSTMKKSSEALGSDRMKTCMQLWKENMDYVLIDAPPLAAVTDAETVASYADASVLVVREDYAPVEALTEVVDNLSRCNAKFLGCVFNDAHRSLVSGTSAYDYNYSKNYDGYGYTEYDYTGMMKAVDMDTNIDKVVGNDRKQN